MMLEIQNLTVRGGGRDIVENVSCTLGEGEWLMLVGPNGAGKSTLVSAAAQSLPYAGRVLLDGADAKTLRPAQLARRLGVLSQSHAVGYAFTVEEVVALGRYAYGRGPLRSRSDGDEAAVEDALALTGLTAQRGQSLLTLSGGELQRAFLAQVFAQDPRVLLLDEPTNHLDLPYQQQIFELLRQWLKTPGRALLSVVHDLSLARAYGTRALLLHHGRAVAGGPTAEVLTPEHLNAVYGMDVYDWMRALLGQWSA
ncbi:MAG: ABC transporter ATP-binding protein [Eubacteriales bacterium]|nr:ABC transporter ATP-binding protein [Eubacteriales bacterium]